MSRLRFWLPALAWAGLIFTLSTDAFSGAHTSRIIIPLLHWLLPRASESTLELAHAVIRKCGHFVEYFILGLLVFRAVRGPERGWKLRWAAIALAIAAAYSASDEFHQSFVPSRGPSAWDSLLDTASAALAQLTVRLIARTDERRGTRNGTPRVS
jgi:VanZ family protein